MHVNDVRYLLAMREERDDAVTAALLVLLSVCCYLYLLSAQEKVRIRTF